MDPDACRNCGHSGKHIVFLDHRCAIHERDDAERDKLQADAALSRARELCETSMALMKRQMQELEDANAAIDALSRALAAAEDRRERVRRDLGVYGDACLVARSNAEAAEEMAIAAAGRYFEAGRAVSALQEREEGRAAEEVLMREMEEDEEMREEERSGEGRRSEERRWQRSNERFCKWLRQSEAQRQIMKSSWTKLRVAERLAGENGVPAAEDEEQLARRNRVQEWAAARRASDYVPAEEETLTTEEGEGGGVELEPAVEPEQDVEAEEEEPEPEPEPVAVQPPPTPAATNRSGITRRAAPPALRTRGRTSRAAAGVATAPPSPAKTTVTTTTGRQLRTARRVESQTCSEPSRTTAAGRAKKDTAATTTKPKTAIPAAKAGAERPTRTRAAAASRAGKTPAEEEAAAGRPQRAARRRSGVQQYPQPQPRWK